MSAPVTVRVSGCCDCPMNPGAGMRHDFARQDGYAYCDHPAVSALQLGHPLETYDKGAPMACPLMSGIPVLVQWDLSDPETTDHE